MQNVSRIILYNIWMKFRRIWNAREMDNDGKVDVSHETQLPV